MKKNTRPARRLQTIVDTHAGAFGGNAQLAKAIGLTNSGLLRGIKKNRLSVESLIRLAVVTGESGDELLRIGGQEEMANVMREVFGESQRANITAAHIDFACTNMKIAIDSARHKLLAAFLALGAPKK